MRDGTPLWFDPTLDTAYKRPQRAENNPVLRARVKEKLDKVLQRRYFEVGLVKSLTTLFGVPKGEDDMRVVYDGSLPGLNAALWRPWFMLPNTNSHLRTVEPRTFMSDVDIAEMFFNFFLDWQLRKYAGVDLTSYFTDNLGKGKDTFWVRWNRIAMGLRPSPFCAVQIMDWLDETVFGEHLDQDNVFRWDVVELNLPGMSQYSPVKPWVYKKRSSDGRIAADVLTYINDARPTGPSEEECWQAARKYASTCNHYGVQDDPRKRRTPSMTAGAWAGTVIHTHMGQVCVKVTQERWDKTRKMVCDIWQEYSDRRTELPVEVLGEDSAGGLNHKQLERRRGFLVYVAHAHPSLVPYLEGIHLTLDSWRSDRNEDGWKRTRADMEHLRRNGCPEETMKSLSDEAPRLVMHVPRL
jgi:hypothetical protein